MREHHVHIGQVAETTGLSLRTIRYYEEIGLVTPSARSSGGFRLYSDTDVDRLHLIKQMKPLGYPLDEMRRLLEVLDEISAADGDSARAGARERLDAYIHQVEERIETLRTHTAYAEDFLSRIHAQARHAELVD